MNSRYIDEHFEEYVAKLGKWVAIKSVSAWAETRKDVIYMVEHVAKVWSCFFLPCFSSAFSVCTWGQCRDLHVGVPGY